MDSSLMCKNCDFSKNIFPFITGLLITLLITHILKYILKVERPITYKGGRDIFFPFRTFINCYFYIFIYILDFPFNNNISFIVIYLV